MSRRNAEQNVDHFDLFPFISILVCTLGFLLMVTLSVAAVLLGDAKQVIVPDAAAPGAVKKEAILVEWDGSEMAIHPNTALPRSKLPEMVSWQAARVNGGTNDTAFGKLIGVMHQQQGHYYIFMAVRPSGFDNLDDVIELLSKQKVEFGYEPFEQNRPIGIDEKMESL